MLHNIAAKWQLLLAQGMLMLASSSRETEVMNFPALASIDSSLHDISSQLVQIYDKTAATRRTCPTNISLL